MVLTYEQIQAAAKKKGISQANVDKFAGLKGVSKPASSSGISTIKNPNTPKQNTNVNAFGDVSGANKATKNTGTGVITANKGLQMKPEEFVYGEAAKQKEASGAGYLQKRNDTLASDFYNKGIKDSAGVQAELSKNAAFRSATPEEQANTVQGILNRMGGMKPTTPEVPEAPVVPENAGKYTDAEGNLVDILGYGDLPDDVKQLVDGMTDADKKMLDMQRGNDVNGKLEYLRQAKRNQEYLTGQRDKTIQINGLNGEVLQIQSSQRLQDAGKNLDNLIQNVGYLGSRGQPGQSSTRLQAANKMISDAQQKFAELKTIETKVAEIRELGLEIDTAAYEKQMADISDDLNMKVGMQIQNAMNEMTAADLSGQLDTIDGVTQFKRSLLQKLDQNITGYTEGSMKQMQYVTEQYQKIADDAQTRLTEWTKNANTVNMDMSKAKGVYTDGNGNPLYNADGTTISMPEVPPMEPVYDKESGQLITFSNDENGQIVAKVQQVTNQASLNQQAANSIAQLVVNGTMSMDNVPAEMRASVAIAMATMKPTTETGYQGPEIAPVATDKVKGALGQIEAQPDGTIGGQCGSFVNDYLQDMGLGRLFIDPIDAKKAIKNSETPTVGSVAIFDWSNNPNATLAQQKYGHVGIVTAVNGDKITVKQSNNKGNEQVFTSTYNAKDAYGFFDPSKGLKPQESTSQGKTYTESQKNMMGAMDAKNLTAGETKMLKKSGLSEEDVYNYQASLKAGKWTEGLNDNEIKRVNTAIDDLTTHPVAKTFQKTQEAYMFAKSVAEGVGATDNQALIYAFAKAMDPDSVVREGEYATVQKYSQVRGDKLGMNINRILNGEEFISEKAKKNIVETINTKYKASKDSYNQIRKNKVKIVNDITGKDIGETVLPSDIIDEETTTTKTTATPGSAAAKGRNRKAQ